MKKNLSLIKCLHKNDLFGTNPLRTLISDFVLMSSVISVSIEYCFTLALEDTNDLQIQKSKTHSLGL